MGKLTKDMVDALEPGGIAWDSAVSGFGCRRRKEEGRFFVLKYRFGGRQRWYTIGRYGSPYTVESARTEARRLLGLVVSGVDPAEVRDKAKGTLTVSELCDQFIEDHGPRLKPRTLEEYERVIKLHIKPKLGSIRVDVLNRSDLAKRHAKMKKTPRAANFMLSVMSKVWTWGQRRGFAPEIANPVRGIERYRENHRDRFLSDAELGRLGHVLREAEQGRLGKLLDEVEAEHNKRAGKGSAKREGRDRREVSMHTVAAIRLLILTGARLSEILTLRWEWVDFRYGCLRLPDSKTGKKIVHLNPPALEVLENLDRMDGNPYVICGNGPRKRKGDPDGDVQKDQDEGHRLVNLQKPWRRIRKAAKLDDVRIHDLRHCFASVGAMSGNSLAVIGALLGHTQAQTTQRYSHFAADPLKAASEGIARLIADAMAAKSGGSNVIELKG